MANSNPPKKNQAFTIRIMLQDMANPGAFKSSPTIAAGDITFDADGGGFGNPATTPSVSPAASVGVLLTFSATEMNADMVTVRCHDQTSPQEWADYGFVIETTA